jgi:mono/diheme cytochrome c family protein
MSTRTLRKEHVRRMPIPIATSDDDGEVFRETCATCHVDHMSAGAADHAPDLLTPPMNLLTTIIRR